MELVKLEPKGQQLAYLKHWDMFEYKNLIHIVVYDCDEVRGIDRKYVALNEGKFYETTIPDIQYVKLVKIENLVFRTMFKYAIVADRTTIYQTESPLSEFKDLPPCCMFVTNQSASKLYFKYSDSYLNSAVVCALHNGVWVRDDDFFKENNYDCEVILVVPDKLSYSVITPPAVNSHTTSVECAF